MRQPTVRWSIGAAGGCLLGSTLAFLLVSGPGGIPTLGVALIVGAFLTAGAAGVLAAVDVPIVSWISQRHLAGGSLLVAAAGFGLAGFELAALPAVGLLFVGVVACTALSLGVVGVDLLVYGGRHVNRASPARRVSG